MFSLFIPGHSHRRKLFTSITHSLARSYRHHVNLACHDRNELGMFDDKLVGWCKAQCNAESSCVSYEFKDGRCQLSTSCIEERLTHSYTGWQTYTKDFTNLKSINVNENTFQDEAINGNLASNTFEWTYYVSYACDDGYHLENSMCT